jgi:uncharacterized protein YjbI with pentapeptide repeats
MDDKQTRTLKRLTKKLSALRQTLSKSERELLDTLILGAPAEVSGHALHGAQVAGAQVAGAQMAGAQIAGAMAAGAVPSAEVSGHAMHGAQVAGAQIAGATAAGAVPSAEVSGHAMASASAQVQSAISFNAAKGAYTVATARIA